MRITRNLLVLLCDALGRIDHHEHDVGAVDGAQRTHDAVALDGLVNLAAAAHAGRVDQHVFLAILDEMRVDGVTRRARDVADDDAVFAENLVDDGRLADIRTADDGDADLVFGLVLARLLRERCDDGVEEIAEVHGVRRRNADGVAEAEAVKLIDVHLTLGAVDLVDGQDDGLLRRAQHVADFVISRREARTAIDDKQDDVGLLHRNLRLLAHGFQDMVALVELDAARVDHRELMAEPLGIEIDAVARDARHVVDDGHALLADLVEKRRLADIRPADDGNDGFAQIKYLLSLF